MKIPTRKPFSIYIASSFRNVHAVQLLRDVLVECGHNVLDWTVLAPPLPASASPESRRMALNTDERGKIFTFCFTACTQADLVVYLGPAGQDAACEVGMAHVAGIPVLGLAGPLEQPGLILTRAIRSWYTDANSLILALCALAVDAEWTRSHLAGSCGRSESCR